MRPCQLTILVSLDDSQVALTDARRPDSLVAAVEAPSPQKAARQALHYIEEHPDVKVASIAFRMRPVLPRRRKRATLATYTWLIKKLHKGAA